MDVEEAISRLIRAITCGRCLPFVGAGLSAWPLPPNASRPDLPTLVALAEDGEVQGTDSGGVAREAAGRTVIRIYEKAVRKGLIERPVDDRSWDQFEGAPPTWFLRACMLARLPPNIRTRALTQGRSFSGLAQECYDNDPIALAHLMDLLFKSDKPNVLHWILALFSFEVVVTTNFDNCLTTASLRTGIPFNSRVDDADLRGNGIVRPLLLKIHGDTSKAGQIDPYANDGAARSFLDHLIITRRQYEQFPVGRELMRDYLYVLLATHQPLFLGYSLRDFDVVNMLERLSMLKRQEGDTSTAIAVVAEADPEDVDDWKRRHVDLVPCDLDTFLKRLWCAFSKSEMEWVKNIPLPPSSGGPNPQIAVNVFMHYAARHPQFKTALEDIVYERFFPATKLIGIEFWGEDGFKRCLAMKWMRAVNGLQETAEGRFYEIPVEIRSRLKEALEVQNRHTGGVCRTRGI